ncbi:MAG: hypothetical protein M3415_03090 [Actinomycetota bacterium]|nr:hypothetical protein [Actinomycetota bacterium]
MVAAYLLFVADDVRRRLAALGLRSLDEAVGRVELLRRRGDLGFGGSGPDGAGGAERASTLDVTALLAAPVADGPRAYSGSLAIQAPRDALGDRVCDDAFEALYGGTVQHLKYDIRNTDRAVGARLGGAVGLEFGDTDSDDRGRVSARFTGEAGQSFGAFLSGGVEFVLTGEANDYVGKGMAGGRIVVRPPAEGRARQDASPVLVGNAVLYGATGGELFVAGRAGERFAVRNSGATAVIEGVGDHACEYMTGGTVVVLGATGANLGAGMTGGECYVCDDHAEVLARINVGLVEARRPDGAQLRRLRDLLEHHVQVTRSQRATVLLTDWDAAGAAFWRIAPRGELSRMEVVGEGSVSAAV